MKHGVDASGVDTLYNALRTSHAVTPMCLFCNAVIFHWENILCLCVFSF